MKVVYWVLKGTKSKSPSKRPSSSHVTANELILPVYRILCRSLPCVPPSFWRDAAVPVNEHIQPPSRPQAMEGSPEGQVPLALSAQDRPPRRRTKRQDPSLAGICCAGRLVFGDSFFVKFLCHPICVKNFAFSHYIFCL